MEKVAYNANDQKQRKHHNIKSGSRKSHPHEDLTLHESKELPFSRANGINCVLYVQASISNLKNYGNRFFSCTQTS